MNTPRLSATDQQWVEWSKQNPYFGVLGFETSTIDESEQLTTFLESGRRDVGRVLELVEKHLGGFERRDAALDFGCGVGRLLAPLAEQFGRVIGVDVAPKMLELARQNTLQFNNIELLHSNRMMSDAVGPFDLVHSFIVLQHIRPAQGMHIINRLLDLVRPGGFFALHFTIGDRNKLRKTLNWLRYRIGPLQWLYNLSKGRPWNEPRTEMNEYSMAEVLTAVRGKHCPYVLVVPYNHDQHVGVMVIGKVQCPG